MHSPRVRVKFLQPVVKFHGGQPVEQYHNFGLLAGDLLHPFQTYRLCQVALLEGITGSGGGGIFILILYQIFLKNTRSIFSLWVKASV